MDAHARKVLSSAGGTWGADNECRILWVTQLLLRCGKHPIFGLINYLAGNAGHDDWIITPIVISADSRWAATGSEDGTIIVWDLESGCISQDWLAEDAGVASLAFSPDSRYIMSTGGRGCAVTTRDLQSRGVRRVGTLMDEGYGNIPGCNDLSCAWSPEGSWIAAGAWQSDDAGLRPPHSTRGARASRPGLMIPRSGSGMRKLENSFSFFRDEQISG